jgi:hypothetical protein
MTFQDKICTLSAYVHITHKIYIQCLILEFYYRTKHQDLTLRVIWGTWSPVYDVRMAPWWYLEYSKAQGILNTIRKHTLITRNALKHIDIIIQKIYACELPRIKFNIGGIQVNTGGDICTDKILTVRKYDPSKSLALKFVTISPL